MEFSSAQMSCVFKVNIHCDGCKKEVMEVLQNLKGVYSVDIDPGAGRVKINGIVNPNVIMSIFDKYGKHGQLSSLKFNGEVRDFGNSQYYDEQNIPHHYHDYGRNPFLLPLPPPPMPPWLLTPPLPPPLPLPLSQTVQPAPQPPPVASSQPENPECCSTM